MIIRALPPLGGLVCPEGTGVGSSGQPMGAGADYQSAAIPAESMPYPSLVPGDCDACCLRGHADQHGRRAFFVYAC